MNWKTQGETGSTKTGDKFSYDSASGWTREISYAGKGASIRKTIFDAIKTATGKGNSIRADMKMDGAGDQVSATVSFPDADPSFGQVDLTVNQWSLDWQRRELAISAAPTLSGLNKFQIQALNRFSENRALPVPKVVAGDAGTLCWWPKGDAAGKLINICDAATGRTPEPMNVASALIEKGVTQFASYVPTLKRTGNFRAGGGQKNIVANIGRAFTSSAMVALEGFPLAGAFTLPCCYWIKAAQSIKYEGSRMIVDSTYEGMTSFENALYQFAKPADFGACCNPITGECTEQPQAGCGGVWLGPGVDCNPMMKTCECTALYTAEILGRCCTVVAGGKTECRSNVSEVTCKGTWMPNATCESSPCV